MYVWAKSASKGVRVVGFGIKDPIQNIKMMSPFFNNAIFLTRITICCLKLFIALAI